MGSGVRRAVIAVAALAVGGSLPAAAQAQQQVAATVVRALDGDTVEVRGADSRTATVRLIGVDAPEIERDDAAGECGARQAAAVVASFTGQQVTLTTEPSQGLVDSAGRVLAYADTVAGADIGLAVIASGYGEVFLGAPTPFARVTSYQQAETAARAAVTGVWRDCAGDFHRPLPSEATTPAPDDADDVSPADEAERVVRRFYFLLNERRHRSAWRLLSASVRRRLGPYDAWRSGFRRSLGTKVNRASVRMVSGRAVVRVAIRSRDRDACSGDVVRQFFRVRWVLARRGGTWVATGVTARKVGGGRVRLSRSACPRPKPTDAPSPPPDPPRPPRTGCHPSYSPCVPTGRDYDCGELGGPYTVTGPDEYRLDADGDGVGCE
ncbi:thermonuclease family protein [Conexibacter sp. SYSU D00693]|uniref:thermonuclease family protein n=1 Tax=Conexibacter sp. SYSU D00693 TaxID=2812560 RepID=UPI00196A846A|nr:thermonuclease family protein [Conexibacter sp. SYSU D00693]